MLLNTLRFGEIEIDEEKILTFPQGLPGFEQIHRYFMIHPDEGIPVAFMQAVDDGDLAFIVTNPFLYFLNYQFDLPESIQKEMSINSEQDVMICSVVSISENQEFSLNLLAPIVMNMKTKIGKQIILHNSQYNTKHRLDFKKQVGVSDQKGE